jgi:hypothetical protein
MILRGDQGTGPGKGPLVFKRGFDEVSIYLPEGSRAGTYDVAVFLEQLGQPLATSTGVATIQNGATALNVELTLSKLTPGPYLLAIRLPGVEWSYYPALVR